MSEEINTSVQWQPVKCKTCGREYQCTPDDDYFNSTTTTDGVCTACLLKGKGCARMVTVQEHRPGEQN